MAWADNELVDDGEPMELPDPHAPRLKTREEEAFEAAAEARQQWQSLGSIIGPLVHRLREAVEIREKVAPACESPIEVDLAIAMMDLFGERLQQNGMEIVPQFRWKRFRMDFAITRSGSPLVFIECDGKEFHSSLPQLENDRKKNAAAQAAGVYMFRFTGRDIWRQSGDCARLVLAHLINVGAL